MAQPYGFSIVEHLGTFREFPVVGNLCLVKISRSLIVDEIVCVKMADSRESGVKNVFVFNMSSAASLVQQGKSVYKTFCLWLTSSSALLPSVIHTNLGCKLRRTAVILNNVLSL